MNADSKSGNKIIKQATANGPEKNPEISDIAISSPPKSIIGRAMQISTGIDTGKESARSFPLEYTSASTYTAITPEAVPITRKNTTEYPLSQVSEPENASNKNDRIQNTKFTKIAVRLFTRNNVVTAAKANGRT